MEWSCCKWIPSPRERAFERARSCCCQVCSCLSLLPKLSISYDGSFFKSCTTVHVSTLHLMVIDRTLVDLGLTVWLHWEDTESSKTAIWRINKTCAANNSTMLFTNLLKPCWQQYDGNIMCLWKSCCKRPYDTPSYADTMSCVFRCIACISHDVVSCLF